jgi:hypothetical protein
MKKLFILLGLFVSLSLFGQGSNVVVTAHRVISTAAASPLKVNLLAYYDFEESSGDLLDQHNSNDGTIVGTPSRSQTGKVNNCYAFNGTTDYINLGTGLLDFTGDFSVSAWANIDVLSADQRIVQNRGPGGAGSQDGWFVRFNVTGDDVQGWVDDAGYYLNTVSDSAMTINKWYHIVMIWDSSTGEKQVYVNNGDAGSETDANLISADFTSGRISTIGASYDGATASQLWDGLIDEIAVWTRKLTTDEVSDLYNSGSGITYSDF